MTSSPPFRVTLLTWTVLSLTVWNIFRLWTAIAWREVVGEFAPQPGPLYIGLTGALWALLGFLLLWGLAGRKSWIPRLLIGCAAAYTLWYWADRLFLQTERANWPFTLIVNLLLLVLTYFTIRTKIFAEERGS
ncbi:MAG: hypothetical protein HY869_14345 [Chloroflexi bacterium]|nr:hypothetical protein [Chloroflexota bacterium]